MYEYINICSSWRMFVDRQPLKSTLLKLMQFEWLLHCSGDNNCSRRLSRRDSVHTSAAEYRTTAVPIPYVHRRYPYVYANSRRWTDHPLFGDQSLGGSTVPTLSSQPLARRRFFDLLRMTARRRLSAVRWRWTERSIVWPKSCFSC